MLFAPIIIIVVIIIVAAQQQQKRTTAAWGEAARRLGITAQAGSMFSRPLLSGNVDGVPVRVDTFTRRSGNSSTTYTRYQVQYPTPGFDFSLRREGGFAKIGRFLGFKDVELGDPAFDGAFTIKTENRPQLEQLLTPSVRSGLFRLLASYPTVVISDGHIGMERTGLERDPNRIESVVRRLVGTAQLLVSPDSGVSDRDVVDRQQGLLNDVADRMRRAVEQHPEDVDQRIFEVETLAAAGQEDAANERLRELETMAPTDPDVLGWKQALETPVTASPHKEVDLDKMAADLFGGNDLSFETREKFNKNYAGANVSWEGVVKEARESRYGGKLVVNVATVENDLYGNTEIDVVIEAAGLLPAKGSKITVSGMLDRIDPLVRNIYLSGANVSRATTDPTE